MQKSKFCPKSTVVLQFQAGIEVDTVIVDGMVFLPFFELPLGEIEVDTTSVASAKPAPKVTTPKVVAPVVTKIYTEDELMEMDTDEVEKIVIRMGGDPAEGEGKKTNKKLRKMVMALQAGTVSAPVAEEGAESEEEDDNVPISKLKVDDEVKVYWKDLNNWFKGVVTQAKGGKVIVHYEDGEKEILDPEVHTKIKLIPVA